MDITKYTNEWSLMDGNLVFPWWAHPFLHELTTWNLQDKVWLEFGAGLSTAWLRSRCNWVDSIEVNRDWMTTAISWSSNNGYNNGRVYCSEINEGDESKKHLYFSMIPNEKYDIISVDGIFRTDAMRWAVEHFKQNGGGILIADNWQQDYVWISEEAEQIMAPYEINRFVQPDHTNHEGRPWNTSYWIIK